MENKKTERILVINPGSTSTKIAVFDDDKQIMAQTIRHPLDEVKAFSWVMDQFDYRMEHINAALEAAGIDKSTLTCVMARGGLLPPVPSGAFNVNKDMIDYFYAAKVNVHISNLACVLADAIARPLGIPAMVYDPVAVDELEDVARITGMPEISKASRGHVLNSRAMSRKLLTISAAAAPHGSFITDAASIATAMTMPGLHPNAAAKFRRWSLQCFATAVNIQRLR